MRQHSGNQGISEELADWCERGLTFVVHLIDGSTLLVLGKDTTTANGMLLAPSDDDGGATCIPYSSIVYAVYTTVDELELQHHHYHGRHFLAHAQPARVEQFKITEDGHPSR